MAPVLDTTPAPARWNHSQRDTPVAEPRPETVEAAVREAYRCGTDLPVGHRKLVRLIRKFLAAHPLEEFSVQVFTQWVYADPTGDTAVRAIEQQATHPAAHHGGAV